MSNFLEVIEQSGLEQKTAMNLKDSFAIYFEKAEEWKAKAESLVVTSLDQKHEMKIAREARLALRQIRIDADKTRKALKEDSLRYGKAVQGVYNIIEYLIVPIEEHLQKQEDFVKIEEEKAREALKENRLELLFGLNEFLPMNLNLGEMSEEDFEKILHGAKLQKQFKEDQEKKAELERIEKERIEKEERERVRLENEKLKAEKEAREKEIALERAKAEEERKKVEELARKEREESDRKLKAEKEAREKIEREIKQKEEQERKEKEKKELELKKLKNAPDKEKLLNFSKMLLELDLELSSAEAKNILIATKTLLQKTSKFINEKVENI